MQLTSHQHFKVLMFASMPVKCKQTIAYNIGRDLGVLPSRGAATTHLYRSPLIMVSIREEFVNTFCIKKRKGMVVQQIYLQIDLKTTLAKVF